MSVTEREIAKERQKKRNVKEYFSLSSITSKQNLFKTTGRTQRKTGLLEVSNFLSHVREHFKGRKRY